jgi:hypothetical protein
MQDFGLTPGKSFYNSADLTKIKTIKSVLDSDPELLGADWAKGLPLDTLDTLSKNPSLKREVKEIRDDQIAFSNSANWTNDEYVNKIFGSPQQMDELNSRYAELREAAKYGDAEASAALVKLDDLDTDNDGDIDLADAKTITSGFKSTDINTYINDYNTNKSDYTPFSTTLGKNIEAGLAYKPGPEKQVAADILRGKVQLDFGNLGMLEKYMQQLPPNSDLHGQANRLIDNLVVNKSNEISNNYRIFSNAGNDILSGNMKAASVDQINSKIEELNTIINDPSQHPRVAERLRGTLNQLIESRTKVESVNAAAKLTGLNLSNLGKRADRYMQYLDSYNTKMFGKNWWNSSDYQRAAAGKPGKKSLPIYPWEAPRMTLIRNVIPNYYAYNRNGDALSLSIESYNNLKTEWDRLGSGSTGSNTSTGSNSTTSKKKTDKDSK